MPDARSRLIRTVALTLSALTALLTFAAPAAGYENQIADQAQAIAEKLADSERRTLAVVDFTDLQGNVTELGRFLAEELSIGLAGLDLPDGGFEVVDRTHLKALLKEHKLSATGLIDPSTAREVGQIAGVGALITGTVTPLGDSVRLAIKVLDTESARIVTSSTANIPKIEAIEELLRREIVSGEAGRVQGARGSAPTATKKAVGFVFRLKRCTLSGQNLACSFTVTNEQEDCELRLYATYNKFNRSRAIDEYGDQYDNAQVRFASHSGSWADETAIQGIPTSAGLTFSGVAPNTSRLAVLEIAGSADSGCQATGGSDQSFQVQFRDVPVYRD